MIKYHILSLLALAVCAITAIEAAAQFYGASLKAGGRWYSSGTGWLMVVVCLGAVYLYFRARKFRRNETLKR